MPTPYGAQPSLALETRNGRWAPTQPLSMPDLSIVARFPPGGQHCRYGPGHIAARWVRRGRPAGAENADARSIRADRSGVVAPGERAQAAFLVSQKMVLISSIFSSSWSATFSSSEDLVPPPPPASLVASLNRACSCGYFSKCGGLK